MTVVRTEDTLMTCHMYMSLSINIILVPFIKYFMVVRKEEYEHIVAFARICIKRF